MASVCNDVYISSRLCIDCFYNQVIIFFLFCWGSHKRLD
jgi:hypothetical protein